MAEYHPDLMLTPTPPPLPGPKPPKRKCSEPGCITILSASNSGERCRLHDLPGPFDDAEFSKQIIEDRRQRSVQPDSLPSRDPYRIAERVL